MMPNVNLHNYTLETFNQVNLESQNILMYYITNSLLNVFTLFCKMTLATLLSDNPPQIRPYGCTKALKD